MGEGLSKDEAEAKVRESFSAEVVGKLEEAKWQDKVEGFKGMGEQLQGMQASGEVVEAVAKYVKMKMKDWKESNINLVKESIVLFTVVSQHCDKVNKRAVHVVMPFLSDKLGDVKTGASVCELLMSLAELVTPKYVALQLIKHASSAKAINVQKETCNILVRITEDFGVTNTPLKEMIEYATLAVNHTNP